jgi:hypothetical protein
LKRRTCLYNINLPSPCSFPKATGSFEPINYRGALLITVLHAIVYTICFFFFFFFKKTSPPQPYNKYNFRSSLNHLMPNISYLQLVSLFIVQADSGTRSWVKRVPGEADHSPPTSVKDKRMWIYSTFSPPKCLHYIQFNLFNIVCS